MDSGTAGGRQRTDSIHVLAKIRALNRTLCVAQTMVYVLNVLSEVALDWVRAHVPVEWKVCLYQLRKKGKEMSQQPSSGQQSGKIQILTALIGAAAVIIAAIIGGIFLLKSTSVNHFPTPTVVPAQSATQNPQSTSTTLPTPTGKTQALPLKNPPLPLHLSCTCDDPVTVTITAITIDSTVGHMIWNLSFQNVSGTPQQHGLWPFYLQASINGDNKMYVATGDAMLTQTSCNIYLGDYLRSGQTVQKSVIFSFIPVTNTQYILTSGLYCPSVTFNPVTLTF